MRIRGLAKIFALALVATPAAAQQGTVTLPSVGPGGVAGEEAGRGQGAGQMCGDARHALLAVLEQVDHLAGHRHRVGMALQIGPARVCGVECGIEPIEALPQRAGPLRGVDHAAVPQHCRLDVGTADVPADHGTLRHHPPPCG